MLADPSPRRRRPASTKSCVELRARRRAARRVEHRHDCCCRGCRHAGLDTQLRGSPVGAADDRRPARPIGRHADIGAVNADRGRRNAEAVGQGKPPTPLSLRPMPTSLAIRPRKPAQEPGRNRRPRISRVHENVIGGIDRHRRDSPTFKGESITTAFSICGRETIEGAIAELERRNGCEAGFASWRFQNAPTQIKRIVAAGGSTLSRDVT